MFVNLDVIPVWLVIVTKGDMWTCISKVEVREAILYSDKGVDKTIPHLTDEFVICIVVRLLQRLKT